MRKDALNAVQKAMYSINIELAPLLLARDHLQEALIELQREPTATEAAEEEAQGGGVF